MDSTKFSKPISLKRIQLDGGNVKRQSKRGSTKLLHA